MKGNMPRISLAISSVCLVQVLLQVSLIIQGNEVGLTSFGSLYLPETSAGEPLH